MQIQGLDLSGYFSRGPASLFSIFNSSPPIIHHTLSFSLFEGKWETKKQTLNASSISPTHSPLFSPILFSAKMLIRIRSRDGLERVTVDNPNITISHLKTLIQNQLNVSVPNQILSKDQNLLLAKTLEDRHRFNDMSNLIIPISYLGITHGSIVYLAYDGERSISGGPTFNPSGSFGRKMTVEDLIAKQMRVSIQEHSHCESVSFDRDAANVFQRYVSETLVFSIKRCGFMYGRVLEGNQVEVNFIYEPPQQGSEDNLIMFRDFNEEKGVDAIAFGLGMKRVGFIFTQTINQSNKGYTMSNVEILQAVELHKESEMKEWVTAVVKLEVREDGTGDVHFEAFQLSDMCVRLFSEGWFDTEFTGEIDPKLSRMKKDVVVGVKDTKEVDNDFFLVVVKILDHQGPLSSTFPVENRITSVTMSELKNHLDRMKSLPFVRRISDFHLLLLLARFLDIRTDVPALAECVLEQKTVSEGYQFLIESIANTA